MEDKKMKQKGKIKITNPEYLKNDDVPSYSEVLVKVQSFYEDIKIQKTKKESSIRNTVSSEFGIPVEIVNEFLCFSEYINRPVLKTLEESKVDKHFFDIAQKVKRQLIKIYRDDELSDQKIMAKVSQAILEMYNEYIETGKVNTKDWKRFYRDKNNLKNQQRQRKPKKSTVRKSKKFKYWTGAQKPSEVRSINFNEINKMLDEVYQGIENINIYDGVKLRVQADKVKKQCLGLANIHHFIMKLEFEQSHNQLRDAA